MRLDAIRLKRDLLVMNATLGFEKFRPEIDAVAQLPNTSVPGWITIYAAVTNITNLSPISQVLKLLEKLGFTLMDKSERIILPVVTKQTFVDRCKILTD